MCISSMIRKWRKRRRDRIYEGPYAEIDGGVRTREDTDAPKQIESRVPISFVCEYSTMGECLDEEDTLVTGNYILSARLCEGGVRAALEIRQRSLTYEKREFTYPAAFMQALDGVIRAHGLSGRNGYFSHVSGLPDMYGTVLSVEYESGECIRCKDNQQPLFEAEGLRALIDLFLNYGTEKK